MRLVSLPLVQPKKRGRPPLTEAQRRERGSPEPRVARPEIKASYPLHVTLRARDDVRSLRSKDRFRRIRDALRDASDRFGMRLVHFAVLDDHVHLIVEARDKEALRCGMQGLIIRVAKAINHGERSGKVFRDRYHAVALDSPRRVRDALAYVILNARRHGLSGAASMRPSAPWIDPCSSGWWFDGWRGDVTPLKRLAEREMDFDVEPPVAAPRTWLLGAGWRRAGLIDPSEVPDPPEA